MLFLIGVFFANAQEEKTVSGTVTDHDGIPLPGVNIVIRGTTSGTQSDFDGNYSLTVSEGDVLVFSYLGQQTTERTVGVSNTINVQMQEDAQALEEVVVIGYGNQEEKKIMASIEAGEWQPVSNFDEEKALAVWLLCDLPQIRNG